MYRNRKRVGAFFLAFALVFSMIGAAFAYNPKEVEYPKVNDKTGKVTNGDFMRAHTRLSETPIWVLTQFEDQDKIDKLGRGGYYS